MFIYDLDYRVLPDILTRTSAVRAAAMNPNEALLVTLPTRHTGTLP